MEDVRSFLQKLPEAPDINGRNEFLNSAVFVPIVENKIGPSLLFEKRARQIRQGGEICFPGGAIDRGREDSALKTAVRETVEELGVDEDRIRIYGRGNTVISLSGAIVEVFIGLLDIESVEELRPNHGEVEKTFLVPISFFLENRPRISEVKVFAEAVDETNLPPKYKKPWGGRVHRIHIYNWREEIIWGITARIIGDLKERFLQI